MKVLEFIHYGLMVFIVTMPLLPRPILRQVYFVPVIIPLLWVICGDCPLTMAHGRNENNDSFSQSIYKNLFPNITEEQTRSFNTLVLISSVYLSSRKLIIEPKTYINQIMVI
jgi:hypothetical protein